MPTFLNQTLVSVVVRLALVAASLGAVLIPNVFAAISNYKISGAGLTFPGVIDFELSRDGRYAVHIVSSSSNNTVELRTASVLEGAAPILLEGPLTSGANIMDYEISPDNSRVVYITRQDFGMGQALWSIPISGGQRIPLNSALVSGGGIRDFWISSDSQRVVYRADQEVAGRYELFSVPLAGGVVTKLNSDLNGTGFLSYPQISPDGQRVTYAADQQIGGIDLYSVSITGQAPIGLGVGSQALGTQASKFSSDSQWVLYTSDSNGGRGLFSVPAPGGTSVPLSDPTSHGDIHSGINPGPFAATPDSQRVVFRTNQLYSVPIAGGPVTQLNGPLTTGGAVTNWSITADSQRAVYIADQEMDDVFELYSVPIAGGAAIKLNSTLVSGGDVFGFAVARNSGRVVYQANQDVADSRELYSVPITGGPPTKLNPPLSGPNLFSFSTAISPNSQFVIYTHRLQNGDCCLFRVPITGGTSLRLHPALVGTPVPSFNTPRFSPDSARVIYRADQEISGVELFVAFDDAMVAPANRVYLPLIVR